MDPDSSPKTNPRHPIESIASEITDSVRGGHRQSIEKLLDSNPQHESKLRELLPVIQQLEKARQAHIQRPAGMATLGASRPDRLGDFELVRQIGRGGMGVVFEAVQTSLGRKVALKILPSNLLTDTQQLRRFEREARTAAALHHTNIVPVFGVGEDQGFHYFVMQRIEGRGLDRVLTDQETKLTPRQVAELGRQAASALAYAHQQKVLHRDIKPANLLVSEQLELWITDFGVAKATTSEAVTQAGDIVGTLRYMAPEQIVGETDVRSDIYSLGVTLYELLAGRPAVDDKSIREVIVARRPTPTPPSLRQLNPDVPVDLQTILQAAMSIDPNQRYQTADAFEKDLQHFLDGESISVRRLPFYAKGFRWAKQNPAIAFLSASSLMLLISVALLSSIGALRLRSAITDERANLKIAENIAEASLGALDHIFVRFSGGPAAEDDENEFSGAPALNSETAVLLEELLPYYDEIDAYTPSQDNSKLLASTLAAQAAIGKIQFNLGRYDQAITAYEKALASQVSPDNPTHISPLQIAKLRNQLGFAHRMEGENAQAEHEHQLAIDSLTANANGEDTAQQREIRFELARAHYLIAMHIHPGMGPNAMPPIELLPFNRPPQSPRDGFQPRGPHANHDIPRPGSPRTFLPLGSKPPRPRPKHDSSEDRVNDHLENLNTAITLLRELFNEDPNNVRYALALARSLRQAEPRRSSHGEESLTRKPREAVTLLEQLHARYQDNDTIMFELSDALADRSPFEQNDGELGESIKDLTRAAENFTELCDRNPNVPKYVNAMVHTHFKLAMIREREAQRAPQGRRRELERMASDSFQRAADGYAPLLESHPDAPGYRAWYALFLQHYGNNAYKSALYNQAAQAFEKSANQWRELIERHPQQRISWTALPTVYRSYGASLAALGKHPQAKDALEKASMSDAYLKLAP